MGSLYTFLQIHTATFTFIVIIHSNLIAWYILFEMVTVFHYGQYKFWIFFPPLSPTLRILVQPIFVYMWDGMGGPE